MKFKKLWKSTKENLPIFLGGTCGTTTWRNELLDNNLLDEKKFKVHNPQLPAGETWTELHREAEKISLQESKKSGTILLAFTPGMESTYSWMETLMYMNDKKTNHLVIAFIGDKSLFPETRYNAVIEERKRISKERNVDHIQIKFFDKVEELAEYLNNVYIPLDKDFVEITWEKVVKGSIFAFVFGIGMAIMGSYIASQNIPGAIAFLIITIWVRYYDISSKLDKLTTIKELNESKDNVEKKIDEFNILRKISQLELTKIEDTRKEVMEMIIPVTEINEKLQKENEDLKYKLNNLNG
jgi:hypothetical protein